MRNKETPLENDLIEISINGTVRYTYPGYNFEDAVIQANQLSEANPKAVVTLKTVNTNVLMSFGPIRAQQQ